MYPNVDYEAGVCAADGSIAVSLAECIRAYLAHRRAWTCGPADEDRVTRFVGLIKPQVYELVVLAGFGYTPDLRAFDRGVGVAAAGAAQVALGLATPHCEELAFIIVAAVRGAVSALASLA